MANPNEPGPVLPFWAILLSSGTDIGTVTERLVANGCRVNGLKGPADFSHTVYYREEMGDNLARYWVRGIDLVEPGELAGLKSASNDLEKEFTAPDGRRAVNIDPGYIDRFAVVAATCKKLPAAVYLDEGIYGIIQLIYCNNVYDNVPWTYKDYSTAADILAEYRRYYIERKKNG
jgi:hypothetical protein